MARNGSGVYSLPSNTAAVSGDTISSTKWNSLTQDLEADMNVDRPIVAGGTGASTALAALTNLFSGASPGGADKIGFWDQSAASFAFLSLGTGLTFNGTTLELDADLSTLAGLTVAADNFIAGNSGGTAWEVKTPANARTSLGLVIGTNVQAYDAQLTDIAGLTPTDGGFIVGNGTNFVVETGATAQTSLGYTAADVLSKLTTVDGAGSGLDADTLDGVQGSAFAQLSSANVFTNDNTIAGVHIGGGNLISGNMLHAYFSGGVGFFRALENGVAWRQLEIDGSPVLINSNSAGAVTLGGPLTARIAASSETTSTLTSASANKTIIATGGITLPASVFTAGDLLTIDGGGTARTITRGSGLTMYVNGTDSATATLTANGVMGVWFRSATVCILTGNVS